jgi:branched-chain amino acid transport system ATP-binding protein
MKSIMGIVGRREGSISLDGVETIGCRRTASPIWDRAVPGGARDFFQPERRGEPAAAAQGQGGRPDVEQIFSCSRTSRSGCSSQGTKLSGGEQQMLAIGAYCAPAPPAAARRATEGLAPVIVQQIGRTIAELKARGFTILLVEQNFHFAAPSRTGTMSWRMAAWWT